MTGRTVIAFADPLQEPKVAARQMGLRYVTDAMPGIRRRRRGRGFIYLGADQERIGEGETLARIEALVLPPAWEDVWICPIPHGHLQATGRDEAGRKQYRYHDRWMAARSECKFHHILIFADRLAALRRKVDTDLEQRGLGRERVLAAVVRLLDLTLIRVGNEEYVQQNGSYGLTTMRRRHVEMERHCINFRFKGKSGQKHDICASDPRVCHVLRKCHELPGQHLFEYVGDAGEARPITSADVNDYLREVTGHDVTAKDFRTWGGTVLAAITLANADPAETKTAADKHIVAAVKQVAQKLGNRPATCRKYYIHPLVLERYRQGDLAEWMNPNPRPERPVPRTGLSAEESAVFEMLTHHAAAGAA